MSIQVALRLSEETVEYVDNQVRLGLAKSRADVVGRAIARERRRATAEKDLEKIILDRQNASSTEFDNLAVMAAKTPLELD